MLTQEKPKVFKPVQKVDASSFDKKLYFECVSEACTMNSYALAKYVDALLDTALLFLDRQGYVPEEHAQRTAIFGFLSARRPSVNR